MSCTIQNYYFELDSNNNIQVYKDNHYFDIIDNFDILSQSEFDYICKCYIVNL